MESENSQHYSPLGEGDSKVTHSWNSWPRNARCCLPVRYIIGVFLTLGFANVYAMRVNLSVALAVMIANHTVMRDGKQVQVTHLLHCGFRKNRARHLERRDRYCGHYQGKSPFS